jgi:hypothetical protein
MQDITLDDLASVTGGAGLLDLKNALGLLKAGKPAGNLEGGYALGQASATIDRAVRGNRVVLDRPRPWLAGQSVNGRIDQMLGPPR